MFNSLTRRELLSLGMAGLALPGCRTLELLESKKAGVAETHVAGDERDFMIARHLKLEGTQRRIGSELARIAKTRYRTELGNSAYLSDRRAFFQASYPAHYERARGVADHYGTSLETGGQDCFELGYNLDVAPACSTVYYPGTSTASGHAMLSRNYDFSTGTYAEITGRSAPKGARAMTADPYVIEMRPDKGIPALYLCAYDLLIGCIDGMNAEGLAVALLANDLEEGRPTRGSRAGLGEIELPRFLLDTCRNVDEARAALEKLPIYYSFIGCHYVIGDRKGRSFVFEYSPDLSQRFFVEGTGRPQVVTNHPLHRYGGKALPPDAEFGSFSRFSRLEKEVAARGKAMVADVKAANRCVMQRFSPPGGAGRPVGRTLWHSVYDLEARTLEVDFYLGEDPANGELRQRRSGYKKFSLV